MLAKGLIVTVLFCTVDISMAHDQEDSFMRDFIKEFVNAVVTNSEDCPGACVHMNITVICSNVIENTKCPDPTKCCAPDYLNIREKPLTTTKTTPKTKTTRKRRTTTFLTTTTTTTTPKPTTTSRVKRTTLRKKTKSYIKL